MFCVDNRIKHWIAAAGVAVLGMMAPMPATAQSPFEAVARINDGVVTRFEVTQRERLLLALARADSSRSIALEELIEDRLKIDAARADGIFPTQDEIDLGIEDFAGRANLTPDEFILALGELDIAPETIRDFVAATLAWGQVVRSRFSATARPSDAEIDRALDLGTGQGSARVLLSEIILPLTPELAAQSEQIVAAVVEMSSFSEFESAARQFSVSPTRENGGRLNWLPLSQLPPQIGPIFLTMKPGEVTQPVPLDGAIALFQFRGLQDVNPPLASNVTIDYALVRFAQGANLAQERAELAGNADTCDDLYGLLLGQPENVLSVESQLRSAVPSNIRAVLDTLDPGEMGIVRPQTTLEGGSVAMLCSRIEQRKEELTREQVAQQLFVRRLNTLADGYLAELRADAFIEQ